MRLSEVHATKSVAYFNRTMARLQSIWEEIGIPEEQRLNRTKAVHKHIKGLLDLMIDEEEALKEKLEKNIEINHKELSKLCSELQLPPFEEEVGYTMLQKEKNSRTHLEVMEQHKRQRMEELKDFIVKDYKLCDIMRTTPFSVDHDAVPSLKQLETYRAYIDDLTKEKDRCHDEFMSIKKDIVVCMDDLEQQPETSFEMDVMYGDEEAFCLSNDNMSALKLLLNQLQERKTEKEVRCSAFRTKIQELWDRLQIPQEEREALSEHMVKSKKKNIEALQAEIQRLEVLKMQSMESIIEAIRAKIAVLWDKCFCSQEQRQAFVPYHDDDFTEELLSLHEAEVRTLKNCYEDHKELFEGVTKWQETWTLYLELDKKANDPSRFNNRGGNLLKEEKQRTDLQKSLPKLEKLLKAQIPVWEQEHGKKFLVHGQNFLEYVQQQWDHHHTEKEREKLERQLKKTKQIQEDMLYGTAVKPPSKQWIAGTLPPGKARKLTGTSTISTPNTFLSAALGGTMCQSSIQKPPLSVSKGCVSAAGEDFYIEVSPGTCAITASMPKSQRQTQLKHSHLTLAENIMMLKRESWSEAFVSRVWISRRFTDPRTALMSSELSRTKVMLQLRLPINREINAALEATLCLDDIPMLKYCEGMKLFTLIITDFVSAADDNFASLLMLVSMEKCSGLSHSSSWPLEGLFTCQSAG